MKDFFIYGSLFAALSIVYCEVLTLPDMILGWWDKLIHRVFKSEWILKPLGDCVYCFSGQVALWGYLLIMDEWYWLKHLLFVGFVIFLSYTYKQIKWN